MSISTLDQALTLVQCQQRLHFIGLCLEEMERVFGANIDGLAVSPSERTGILAGLQDQKVKAAYMRTFIENRIEAIKYAQSGKMPSLHLDWQEYQAAETAISVKGINPKNPLIVADDELKRKLGIK